jgi:hypothetical protein
MIKYFIIQKNKNGSVTIKDTVTENKTTYYFYSLENAIKEHRKAHNLQRLKFERIYL